MIVCNLTKPESTLDQVKKTYPKLAQTDAAQIAIALVLSGRYAQAVYESETFNWPDDYKGLTAALMRQLEIINQSQPVETKKMTKAAMAAALEEDAVEVRVGLVSNYAHGEKMLADREDLKTLFSEILHKGIEYQYSQTDIGWQWSLDRANWNTMSDGELTRRVKLKTTFQGDAVGVEMGLSGKKKSSKKAAVEAVPDVEVVDEIIDEAIVEA